MADPELSTKKGSNRYYEIEGESFASVTTILGAGLPKPALPRWAAKVAAEYAVQNWYTDLEVLDEEAAIKAIKSAPFKHRDKRAALGTLIHESIEAHYQGDEDWQHSLSKDEVGYVYAALATIDSMDIQPLRWEATVFSRKYGYAGTADIVGLWNDQRVVLDWKTSKAAYRDHCAQISAYCLAEWIVAQNKDELEPFAGAEKGLVVSLKETGEFVATPVDPHEFFPLFLAAKSVFDQEHLKVPEALRV